MGGGTLPASGMVAMDDMGEWALIDGTGVDPGVSLERGGRLYRAGGLAVVRHHVGIDRLAVARRVGLSQGAGRLDHVKVLLPYRLRRGGAAWRGGDGSIAVGRWGAARRRPALRGGDLERIARVRVSLGQPLLLRDHALVVLLDVVLVPRVGVALDGGRSPA